ncbi:UDP-N-acetylglucosamine 2-epimerase (non-hydrolyzing) [Halomonas shantousis]
MAAFRIMLTFGSRVEAIKTAPLIHALRQHPHIEARVFAVGQQQEMLDHVLEPFDLETEHHLTLPRPAQSLNQHTASLLPRLDEVLIDEAPDMVMVHGDSPNCLVTTLAAFHRQIPVAHLEAGVPTGPANRSRPEEANRRLARSLATVHFAPTAAARDALINEGTQPERIVLTGNILSDALLWARQCLRNNHWQPPESSALAARRPVGGPLLLVNTPRCSFDEGTMQLCQTLAHLADRHPELRIAYPVPLNSDVRGPIFQHLAGRANVQLLPPLDYAEFVYLLDRATLILSDSDTLHEETPSLGKPLLVLPNIPEPQVIDNTPLQQIEDDRERAIAEVEYLLSDQSAYQQLAQSRDFQSDGKAYERIVSCLEKWTQPQLKRQTA